MKGTDMFMSKSLEEDGNQSGIIAAAKGMATGVIRLWMRRILFRWAVSALHRVAGLVSAFRCFVSVVLDDPAFAVSDFSIWLPAGGLAPFAGVIPLQKPEERYSEMRLALYLYGEPAGCFLGIVANELYARLLPPQ